MKASLTTQGAHGGTGHLHGYIDYSANLNPLGPPDWLHSHWPEALTQLQVYPDPDYTALRSGLAQHFNLPLDNLAVGNGASDLLRDILHHLKPQRTLMLAPSFSEYAHLARLAGSTICWHYPKATHNFRLQAPDLLQDLAISTADTLILGNPNNPCSQGIDPAELQAIIAYTAQHQINLIIDEAFIGLTIPGTCVSARQAILSHPFLFVVDAATKLFALPGIRLAWVFAPAAHISALRSKQVPWSVNGLAASLVPLFPKSKAYLEQTQSWLSCEPQRFAQALSTIPRLQIIPPQSCFILCQLLNSSGQVTPSAAQIRHDLATQHGILIRDASNFPGLSLCWFRLAVRSAAENHSLLNALMLYLGHKEPNT